MDREPHDGIRERKLAAMSTAFQANAAAAARNRVALVKVSPRRWMVVEIGWAVGEAPASYYRGQVAFGPASRERCEAYLSERLTPKAAPAEGKADGA